MTERVTEHERCDACGFDGSAFGEVALLGAILSLGPRWRALIDDSGDDLRSKATS